jgi:Spy/CpxP family protein refolding chaperone
VTRLRGRYRWRSKAPWWVVDQRERLEKIDRKVSAIMATQAELTDGVHQLFGVVDTVIVKLGELVAGGTFDSAAAQALLDEVNAERQRAADALSAVNPPAPPA